jgi:hypothetical protein
VKTIVHVNQHKILANLKSGERDPVLTVKTYKDNRYAHSVLINGPCRVVYSPDKPLSCGARVWIETDSNVEVTEVTHSEEENIPVCG